MGDEGAGDEGAGRKGPSFTAKKRLTLVEYQTQFVQRLAAEKEVFGFAIAKLETILAKNSFMEAFALRVCREVETTFVTTTES